MSRQVFTGAAIFDGARLREGLALVVEDGIVAALVPEREAPAGEIVALSGGILAPGFVDLQVNGGGGILLGDRPDIEGIRMICDAHAGLGTAGLLPTLITDTPEVTRAVVAAGIAAAEAGVPGFLGLHLEGPHLDPVRKGAHDPALIRPMDADDLALCVEAAHALPALMVTVAPESVTPQQVAALAGAGAVVSLGHSDTGFAGARAMLEAGARCVTHLFNAMSPLGHREAGLVGAALEDAAVHVGLIADGIHVAPEVMRIALRAKGEGVFVVTDAMAVAGTDLGEFRLAGRRILRRDGRLTLEDGTLAGADLDMATAIGVLVRDAGVGAERALAMATSVPAGLIGAAAGRLEPGARADLVHLGDGFALAGVWRAGVGLGEV